MNYVLFFSICKEDIHSDKRRRDPNLTVETSPGCVIRQAYAVSDVNRLLRFPVAPCFSRFRLAHLQTSENGVL